MSELKIKIKETVEETRPIMREEHFAIKLVDFPLIVDRPAMKFLESLGYVYGSQFSKIVDGKYTTEFGCATFKTVTIRDATDEEVNAWYLVTAIDKNFLVGDILGEKVGPAYYDAHKVLRDKVTILELVE